LSHKSFSGKFGEIGQYILCTPKKLPIPTSISHSTPIVSFSLKGRAVNECN